jgi:hypothetical protein
LLVGVFFLWGDPPPPGGGGGGGGGGPLGSLLPNHLPSPTTRSASSGTLLPSTGGYIKKRDQSAEPEVRGEKGRKGGRRVVELRGCYSQSWQALLSKSGQPQGNGEGREEDRLT